MEKASIARTPEDVLAHISEGYCLVLQKETAFLVEGMMQHGLNRQNVPADLEAARDCSAKLKELSEKEIRQRCRPLHRVKGEKV